MAKRFEKKETDKSQIKKEEKKVSLGKKIVGLGGALVGTVVLISQIVSNNDSKRS